MANDVMIVHERITTNPRVMAGKPVVKGTRIPVERVLRHLEENDRVDLFEAFPELTEEDIRACLEFARNAIERQFRLPGNTPTAAL
jgi:uncharacterized protein (DUF433 family)